MALQRNDGMYPNQATPQGSSGSRLSLRIAECVAGLSERMRDNLEADKSVAALSLLTEATANCGAHLVGLKTATQEAEKIVHLVVRRELAMKSLVNLTMTALMCTVTLFTLFGNVPRHAGGVDRIADYLSDFGAAMGRLHNRIEDLARNCIVRILFRRRIKKRIVKFKQDILSVCVGRLRDFIHVPAVAGALGPSPTARPNLSEAEVWQIAESASEGRPWARIISDNVTLGDDTANAHTSGAQAAGSTPTTTSANATTVYGRPQTLFLQTNTRAPSTIGHFASTNGSVTIINSPGACVINGSSSDVQVFRG